MSYNLKKHYIKCFSCEYIGNIVPITADYQNISKQKTIIKLVNKYKINKDLTFINYLKNQDLEQKLFLTINYHTIQGKF